jgi:hypothetical protein
MITNKVEILHPFGHDTEVKNAQVDYLHRMQEPQQVFVTAAILPQFNANQVETFVQQHLHGNPAVRFYYLIFTHGQQYDTHWPDAYASKLVWCCSITSEFKWNLREACAKANDLNIEYCGRRARQFEHGGQIGHAHSYTEKKRSLVRLQRIYLEELYNNID